MHSARERLVVYSVEKMATSSPSGSTKMKCRTSCSGDSSPTNDAAVRAFDPDSDTVAGPTVFIATDAGAEGLNLGRCCSTLVNMDIPWTPGRLAQRNARVRRVDSEQDSFLVVNLIIHGTLEEGILRMVEHKADLADAVLGENQGRRSTTGRGGRNIFDEALSSWSDKK